MDRLFNDFGDMAKDASRRALLPDVFLRLADRDQGVKLMLNAMQNDASLVVRKACYMALQCMPERNPEIKEALAQFSQ